MNPFELGFFSIPVTNMEKAEKFYESVMGWKFQIRDSSFAYILADENMIGSLETASDSFQPSENGCLMYFRADFMSKTLERVKAGGGIVKESVAMENGARGYTAKVLDPFGNKIGFWAAEA